VGAGSGWQGHGEALRQRLGDRVSRSFADYFPCARTIAQLAVTDFQQGLAVQAAAAVPVYLRDQVARKAVVED
jgi:tRNA threonylcarbamoyladenosine biosynthesis protein TsaB